MLSTTNRQFINDTGKEGDMSKVAPWHSKKTKDVHHDNSKCTLGNNIEPENRVSGTGGLPKCSQCERLDKEGR